MLSALKEQDLSANLSVNGTLMLRRLRAMESWSPMIPVLMYKSLFPGLPYDVLRKSIDKRVTLVAYNKQEIKQLGQCCLNVLNMSTGKRKHVNSMLWKTIATLPVAMRDEFQEEINSMVKAGTPTKLDKNQGTEWLNSFVAVRKPSGKLRVCLDPTDLNPCIIRPVCNSNTLDDIVHKLHKAKYMACFDALRGFFHVPLDENSELLTAMFTPIGVFIYNVLTMGLTNANDIFEQCIRDILHGLDGVFNIADDILVIGETYGEFKDNVIRFLDRCVEKDLHLNADKFKLL